MISLKGLRARLPVGWIAVVAIALCVFLVSVPASKMILGGDSPWPELDPGVAIGQRATLWADYAGFGKDNSFNRAVLPIVYVDDALHSIGASPLFSNHFWLLLILVAQAVGAVRLLLLFFPHAARKPAVMGFVASAALLNPYILLNFHTPYPALDLGIVCAPGMFASVAAFVRTGRTAAVCEALVWICLASPANTNPAYVMEHVLLIAIAIALGAGLGGWRIWSAASRAAVVVLAYLAVNLVFWIPMAAYAAAAFSDLVSDGSRYTADTIRVTAEFSSLGDVLRLVGGYLFFNPVGPTAYIPEHSAYVNNPVVVTATLGLPLLAFSGVALYWRRPERKLVIALALAAVALLFLCKGAAPPGGEAFQWLVAHASWFAAFRDAFGKFGWVLLLVYTTLAGGALLRMIYALRYRSVVATTICFIFVLISGFPIVSGHLFWGSAAVLIPPQYARLAAVVRQMPPDSRLLEMPIPPTIFDAYRWGYVGAGLTTNLVDRSLVSREFDFGESENAGVTEAARTFKYAFGQRRLLLLLGLLGVTDIVRDGNADTNFYLSSPANDVSTDVQDATRTFSSNGLDLFHLHDQIVNPRIYAADRLVVGARTPEEIALACGILQGCRGAAFAPDDIATRWPAARARLATIATLGGATSKDAVRSARRLLTIPMPGLVRAATTAVDRSAYIDYADGSASVPLRSRIDSRFFEHHPPIKVGFSGTGASFAHVYEFDRFKDKTRALCARDGRMTTNALQVHHTGLQGAVALLAFKYDADAGGAFISVSSTAAHGTTSSFYMLLPAGRGNAVLRLFRPVSNDLSVVVGVTTRSGIDCIRLDDLTVATANVPARWTLSGSPNDMFVTPPYSAAYATIVGDAANRGIAEANRIAAPNTMTAAPNAGTATGIWSAAEVLSGTGNAAIDSIDGDGASPMTLHADRAMADSHMQIEHLTPGATYAFNVPVLRWGGVAPRVVFLSQTGDVLYDSTLPQSQKSTTLRGYVTNPADSSKLLVYAYTGSPSAKGSFVSFGPTSVSLSKNFGAISWQTGATMPVPASIHFSRTDPSDYAVNVYGAPDTYLLVLGNSYNDSWEVTAPAGVTADHLSVNLGENAWIVRGRGTYTLTIAYANDRFRAYATIAAALCAVATVLLYLILRIRRERPTPHDVA